MNRQTLWRGAALGLLCALLVAWGPPANAGLPRPGVVLFGQVVDSEGMLITAGDVLVTFAPTSGGGAVSVTVPLRLIAGPGENYSYSLVVPVETALPGHGATPTALLLSATPREYTRTVSVAGTGLSKVTTVSLSTADIAGVQRVDLCANCPQTLRSYHSGDSNRDQKFSLSEFLRMIELHTATPNHDYHTDKSQRDGFAPGTGPRTGEPHAGDYYGGANWRFTMPEVVRIIDLFASTPDHSYAPAANTEDGFIKGRVSRPVGLATAGMKLASDPPAFYRIIEGGTSATGSSLQVSIVTDGPAGALSALGIEDTLPAGWSFGAIDAGAPMIAPAPGAKGTLSFAWYPIPAEGAAISFRVDIDDPAAIAAGLPAIAGAAVYRTYDGESQTVVPLLPPSAAGGLADTDGDGIPDVVENGGTAPGDDSAGKDDDGDAGDSGDSTDGDSAGPIDSDGDGVPDYADGDSDDDGLTDQNEANSDGDPAYNPYDPVTNPSGTDTSTTKVDTDGDGASDRDELDYGTSPIDPGDVPPVALGITPGLPVAGPFGLAALAGLMMLAARRRR